MTGVSGLAQQTTELLQQLIRNAAVNDGTPDAGQEWRQVRTLQEFFAGSGIEGVVVEPHPGRESLIVRIEGTDRRAPSLALVGHTDVVPVEPSGWERDPFGGEIVDGVLWGRGAIDMLNFTAAYAVVTRDRHERLPAAGRPRLRRRRRRGEREPVRCRVAHGAPARPHRRRLRPDRIGRRSRRLGTIAGSERIDLASIDLTVHAPNRVVRTFHGDENT